MQQSNLPNLPIPHNNNYFKLFLHNLYLFSKCYHFWVLFFLTAYKIFPPFLPRQLTYPEMAWPMWNPNLTHSCGSPRIGHRSSASGGGRPSGRSTRRIYCCTPRGRPGLIRTDPSMSHGAGLVGLALCYCGAAYHPARDRTREIDVA